MGWLDQRFLALQLQQLPSQSAARRMHAMNVEQMGWAGQRLPTLPPQLLQQQPFQLVAQRTHEMSVSRKDYLLR
jgi:hypothetical protein